MPEHYSPSLLGCHTSCAGGLLNGISSGLNMGCNTVQIFVKSPQQWSAKPLESETIQPFREASRQLSSPVIAHDSYLINLCADDPEKLEKSREAFKDELTRCEALGIGFLVTHMGACGCRTEEDALALFVESLDEILATTDGFETKIALETTAGQGKSLGYRFDHFTKILSRVERPERLVVCFDTCHVFASGYDLRGQEGYRSVLREFDDTVGIEHIKVFHVNDSKKALGSRVDRHEHIGKGAIGEETFAALLRDPRFRDRPKILETPQSETMHPENLKLLKALAGESEIQIPA